MAKILIIEDHLETSEFMQNLLKINGLDSLVAPDGMSGLEKARTEKPDLILLDLMMPEMDGFEVCRQLKTDPGTASIPIIIVSVRASEDSISKGKSLGAVDYITKPFDPAKLIETMKKFLK